MDLAKPIEQSSSEKVEDNKDVRASAVKSRKIITTTAYAILVGRKLLIALTKVILLEGGQNMKVKKVWIETIG